MSSSLHHPSFLSSPNSSSKSLLHHSPSSTLFNSHSPHQQYQHPLTSPSAAAAIIAQYGGGGGSSGNVHSSSSNKYINSSTPSLPHLTPLSPTTTTRHHHSQSAIQITPTNGGISATSSPSAATRSPHHILTSMSMSRALTSSQSNTELLLSSPTRGKILDKSRSRTALNLGSSPSSPAASSSLLLMDSSATVGFRGAAPSSFIENEFNPCTFYTNSCAQIYNLSPNSMLLKLFSEGFTKKKVWDCGYLYLGHRGVLPLLDVIAQCTDRIEELSLRGTGMRNTELMKLIEIIRSTKMSKILRTLDVGENPISEKGGNALLLLVNLAPALTRVNVEMTHIDNVTIRAITSTCLNKLALNPSVSKLSNTNNGGRRYVSVRTIGKDGSEQQQQPNSIETWKNRLLESMLRRDASIEELMKAARNGMNTTANDEAKAANDALQKEKDKQTVRLLLRSLQTDNDIIGLLIRYDHERHPEVWRDVRIIRRFVKRLIETGHHRKAFELADKYINPKPVKDATSSSSSSEPPPNFQTDQVLQWWRIYALARSRNFTDAFKEINLLLPKNLAPTIHANLLGLAGMLRKCLYESGSRADYNSIEGKLQEEDANESANLYLKSYETANGLMEGIAAATMLRLGGKNEESTILAKKLLKDATAELAILNRSTNRTGGSGGAGGAGGVDADIEKKLSLFSTLAEANINLQRPNAAYKYYQQAVEVAGTNVNHLSQLQQNLQLLSAARVRIGDVMQLFHAGNVCVFNGLAVDHPLYDAYAFPPERDLELEISYQMELQIEQHQIQIGFVSLSCGSEILFAEKMIEKKGELHVVLPFHLEDFFASSIDYGLSSMYRWHARAQAILKRCEVHYVTGNERFLNDHGLFTFQSLIMEGLAIIRARELGVGPPIALAVLDSSPPFQGCRPNCFIRAWKAKKATTCVIDLQDARRRVLNLPGVPLASQKSVVKRFSEAAQSVDAPEENFGTGIPPVATATHAPTSTPNPPSAAMTPPQQQEPGSVSASASDDGSSSSTVSESAQADMFTAKPPPANNIPVEARQRRPTTSHQQSQQQPSESLLPNPTNTTAVIANTISTNGKIVTAMQFASKITRVVKYMMFADIEPTSTVSEELTPVFFKTFFKLLEKTRKESRVSPFYANTWGSGLYFIFHTVDQCAEFSLHLLQVVAKMDWHSLGLPEATACLGMHGGPLFPGYNPVEEKDLYFGAHVCRAARIKAVTPDGHAYASEQFVAALAVVDGDSKKFFFEYLGHRDLAKSYDRCALYRLCRIGDVRKHALIPGTSLSSSAAAAREASKDGSGKDHHRGSSGGQQHHHPITMITPPTALSHSSSSSNLNAPPPRSHSPKPGLASPRSARSGSDADSSSATDSIAPSTGGASSSSATGNARARTKDKRHRDNATNKKDKSPSTGFSPTPFTTNDVGLLNSGPLTALTIDRATPFFVSKLVEHYLSLDTNSEGLMYWEDCTLLHSLVSRLIALGQTHVAFLVIQKALAYDSQWKNDLKLKYYRVLALRHTQKADEFMKELQETIQSHSNPASIPVELRAAVLSLSGRMLKDRYYESVRNNQPNITYAHESAREYFYSYELKNSSFPAINAATMLLLSKQKERARALAKFSVRLVADELLARSRQHWNLSAEEDRNTAAAALEGASLTPASTSGDGVSSSSTSTTTPPRKDKILGDGTVLDEKLVQEENERAARGEIAPKTSEKAPGEGAKGGPVGEEYWMYAAMGEAYLVLEEQEKCISWYRHALEKASGHMGSISTMYRNFLLLQSSVTVPKELHDLFLSSLGRVLVCASHPLMPWTGPYKPESIETKRRDGGGESDGEEGGDGEENTENSSSIPPPITLPPTLSASLQFYRTLEEHVLIEIRKHLDSARPTVSFVFMLTDTDLLFTECLMERGVEVHILLVHNKPTFLDHCREYGFPRLHNWEERMDIVFKRCILHFVTRDKQKNAQKQLLYHFNRRVLQGLTILRAQQLDCGQPLALCVLDGLDTNGAQIGDGFDQPHGGASSSTSSPSGRTTFPPLDRSSAGLEFPQQWCALNADHTCTIINLNALRQNCQAGVEGQSPSAAQHHSDLPPLTTSASPMRTPLRVHSPSSAKQLSHSSSVSAIVVARSMTSSPVPTPKHSTGHSRVASRRPSVGSLAELIVPQHAPIDRTILPRDVDVGMEGDDDGGDSYDWHSRESAYEAKRKAREQADAISKAVDATYASSSTLPPSTPSFALTRGSSRGGKRPTTGVAPERMTLQRQRSRVTLTSVARTAAAVASSEAEVSTASGTGGESPSTADVRPGLSRIVSSHRRTSSTPLNVVVLNESSSPSQRDSMESKHSPPLPSQSSPKSATSPTTANHLERSSSSSNLSRQSVRAHKRRTRVGPLRSAAHPLSPARTSLSVNSRTTGVVRSVNPSSFIGPTLTEASYTRAVRFIIFADVRNYSKLSQEQTPLFCTHFLNIVRQVIDLFLEDPLAASQRTAGEAHSPNILFWNTWGDGLFVVFDDPAACARFALVLLQKVHQTKWQMYGLPSELTMRVGMHAGPVLVGWDPVVRHMNYFGPHVLYAQLIEPITTPGCAFATGQFAACLATSPEASEFKLEYIGSAVLEKEFADDDYAALSNKEKQDFARCHLYSITPRTEASSGHALEPETQLMQQHSHKSATASSNQDSASSLTSTQQSPSLTYSLLKIDSQKTEQSNAAVELQQQHPHLPPSQIFNFVPPTQLPSAAASLSVSQHTMNVTPQANSKRGSLGTSVSLGPFVHKFVSNRR